MSKLEPPDLHHLSAAVGWLELGNPAEAAAELDRIAAEHREHPDVLEVRWQICAERKDWEAALAVARPLRAQAPDRVSGWLNYAYALRRVQGGGLAAAWDALLPAYERFPKVPVVPYNLACYAAQLGRLDEAWDWLRKAIAAAGEVAPIKAMALADSDLEPLWPGIRAL